MFSYSRFAKIRSMLNGTNRPTAAVRHIWSQNGQTRKHHAYQLYGKGIKLNKLRFWAINYMPTCVLRLFAFELNTLPCCLWPEKTLTVLTHCNIWYLHCQHTVDIWKFLLLELVLSALSFEWLTAYFQNCWIWPLRLWFWSWLDQNACQFCSTV